MKGKKWRLGLTNPKFRDVDALVTGNSKGLFKAELYVAGQLVDKDTGLKSLSDARISARYLLLKWLNALEGEMHEVGFKEVKL